MNKITNNIWLGSHKATQNADRLLKEGITAILNVAAEIHVEDRGLPVTAIKLVDEAGNSVELYMSALLALHALVEQGHTVLLHCQAGVSRSPSILLGYLLLTNKVYSVDEAINILVECRPKVWPEYMLRVHIPSILKAVEKLKRIM